MRRLLSLVEQAMQWSRITDLPPEQQQTALAAFAQLAYDQRGTPESMIENSVNPGINASAPFRTLVEHIGDLTHRMAQRHCERIDYGFEYVSSKLRMALRALKSGYGIERDILEELRSNWLFAVQHNRYKGDFASWKQRWLDAGDQYAQAHRQLVVWNDAQWHAREAAVALGQRAYPLCTRHLEALQKPLEGGRERWVDYASQVHIGPDKLPVAFSAPV